MERTAVLSSRRDGEGDRARGVVVVVGVVGVGGSGGSGGGGGVGSGGGGGIGAVGRVPASGAGVGAGPGAVRPSSPGADPGSGSSSRRPERPAEPSLSPREIVAATRPRRFAGGAAAAGFAGTSALALPGCALSPGAAAAPAVSPWSRPNLTGRLVELSGQGGAAVLTAAMRLVVDAQSRGETTAWVTTRESNFFPPDAAQAGVELEALAVVRVPDARLLGHAAERLVRCGAFGLVVVDLAGAPVVSPASSTGAFPSSRSPASAESAAAAAAREPSRGAARGVPSVPAGVAHRSDADVPLALLTRLLGLAERHDTVVLFLTEKAGAAPSLGPLVSLRAEARRERMRRSAETTAPGASSTQGLSSVVSQSPSGAEFLCEIASLRDRRRPSGWSEREVRRGPDGLR